MKTLTKVLAVVGVAAVLSATAYASFADQLTKVVKQPETRECAHFLMFRWCEL